MTARIFISYSSKDTEIAKFIHEELTKRGVDVFIDYRSIDDGDDFFERIAREVEERDRVLFLVSKHSVGSKWVKIELQHAFENDKPITPIALDDTAIPRPLFFVGKLHRRAFERSAEYMARLCGVLGIEEKTLSIPAVVDPSPSAPLSHASEERGDSASDAVRTPPPAPSIKRVSSLELMPPPFAWVDIPGKIGKKWTGEPYKIAKYPVTNAQYKVFMDAGGYRQPKWWTEEGWDACGKGWHINRKKEWAPSSKPWTQPRHWKSREFSGTHQPVVGVSWFEAMAFCNWLSEITGEPITLPTEAQWQYAAQGDDDRGFPWGDTWDALRCNHSVAGTIATHTTPVWKYEGKGDSYFGNVDMAGNIWEWCFTEYETGADDPLVAAEYRVLRGGCFIDDRIVNFRCAFRNGNAPVYRNASRGFRIVCR